MPTFTVTRPTGNDTTATLDRPTVDVFDSIDTLTARRAAKAAAAVASAQNLKAMGGRWGGDGLMAEGGLADEERLVAKAERARSRVVRDDGELYPIPSEASLDGEYTEAADLRKMADELIHEHHHTVARDCGITYLWRDKGGKSKGSPVLGKCQKPSGLLKHFSLTDIVIWLAADHLREMGATYHQVRASPRSWRSCRMMSRRSAQRSARSGCGRTIFGGSGTRSSSCGSIWRTRDDSHQ